MSPGQPTPSGDALLHEPRNELLPTLLSEHLETVAERCEEAGQPLPGFVLRELRELVGCGDLSLGFYRATCTGCGLDRIVGFSCKRRSLCPRCGGRRMAQRALWWRQRILPRVPVRQWVLTLPVPLRLRLAWDDDLRKAILAVVLRTIFGHLKRAAKKRGLRAPRCGSITATQRFGSALNLNIHFHILVPDGVFVRRSPRHRPHFVSVKPTTEDVQLIVFKIARRVHRLLDRRGLLEEGLCPDEQEHPFHRASVSGRTVLGERPNQPVARLQQLDMFGNQPTKLPRRCALFRGFNLHAGVRVGRHQRDRLERLCRYIARPPLALDRLKQRKDGKILLTLKRPWSDGTRALLFEPEAFVERLCALIWKPRVNTVHYHGIFASGSAWRAEVVPDGVRRQKQARLRRAQGKRLGFDERWVPWLSMLSHVFGHDERCPGCGAKRWVYDAVLGPWRVRRELLAMGTDRSPREFAPARGPPSLW